MKLVLVEWLDSHAGRGWQDEDNIKSSAIPLYCKSVGWLLVENHDVKVIVPHISSDSKNGVMIQACGDIIIPNKSIVKFKALD